MPSLPLYSYLLFLKMRSILALPVVASSLVAAASATVSYDGAKAMRVSVGEDVTPVMSLINSLELPTWKGAPFGVPKPNSMVDVVVPKEKVAWFESVVKSSALGTETMHEDLGLAIASESTESVYEGKR